MSKLKKIIPDDKCNMVALIWPSMYIKKPYWEDMISIYWQIILILLKNKNHVLIVMDISTKEIAKCMVDLKKELEEYCKKNKYSTEQKRNIISLSNKYFHIISYKCNDIWVRDFGPQQVKLKSNDSFLFYQYNFNGYGEKFSYRKDKDFSKFFIKEFKENYSNRNLLTTEKPFQNLIIEGGNIQFNNKGSIIFNKRCVQKNNNEKWNNIKPVFDDAIHNKQIQGYFYIDLEPLNGDDTNGHIDNLVRFYKNKILLYMSSNDSDHPDFYLLKELKDQLKVLNKKTSFIDNFVAINHSSENSFKKKDGSFLPFSYLNFIITNNILIYPILRSHNEITEKRIKKIFCDKNIYFIDVEALLKESGGLHCCTLNLMY